MDVHPEPAAAMCDGDQALTGDDIRELATAAATMPALVGKRLTPPGTPVRAAVPAPVG